MKAVIVGFFIFVSSVAFSQNKTWNSAVQSNWNNAANWLPAGVPTAANTVIFNGGGNCVLDVAPTVTAIQMSVTYTGQIIMNGNTLTISGAGVNILTGGSFSGGGIASTLTFNSQTAVPFAGTDTDANVSVTGTLTTANGEFSGTASTTFGGPVNITAHSILLNGSTYNGTTTLTKSSISPATNSIGTGGNWFRGTTTIHNAMNATFRTASTTGDTFDGALTLILDGTDPDCKLELAHGLGTTTQFNNNIRVKTGGLGAANAGLTSVSGGFIADNGWIMFGQPAAPLASAVGGLSTLATGFTIREEAGASVFDQERDLPGEFLWGDLVLNNFTQLGNTTQSINLRIPNLLPGDPSVTALRLIITNSTFNGSINSFSASNLYISGSTFNGTTNTFIKTVGSGSDGVDPPPSFLYTWDGGNTFNNTTTIENRGQCTMVLAGTTGDTFNGNVTFTSNQDQSAFMIANLGTTTFKGNITLGQNDIVPSPPNIQFGYSGGSVVFEGAALQTLSSTASIPTFRSLTIKNANGITLSIPIVITNNLDFVTGIVNGGGSNYVSFLDGATATNAKNSSFVDGIVRKTGNDAFTFPIGDNGTFHPLGISAPSNATSEFSAQYFLGDHGAGSTADGGMVKVSDCEFWLLNRLVGTDNVSATLYWNEPSSFCHTDYITPGFEDQLRVARWSGALWNNLGQTNLQGAAADGTDGNFATSGALPDANSHALTFGSLVVQNMLPITLLSFEVVATKEGAEVLWQTATENDNDFFTIERMQQSEFVAIAKVRGAGTTNTPQNYKWADRKPLPGLSYYRLKQTDFNGTSTYSEVVALNIERNGTPYPNPVKDILHLDGLTIDHDSKVTVSDVTGHIVINDYAGETLDVSSLKPGIYHVAVQSEGIIQWYSIKKE